MERGYMGFLGGGLSGSLNSNFPVIYPHQMTVFGDNLIVCGNFLKAGSQMVNGIARWNGQNWQALGEGFNDVVYGVGVFNGTLYAEERLHRFGKHGFGPDRAVERDFLGKSRV